jgi:ABC-type uncharacterized transport system substrate-binding protein
MLSEVDVLDQ